MAIVELPAFEPMPSPPSTLAFASDVPYLAAGTAPGSSSDASLTIYGATPEAGIRDLGAAFSSPAGFWRVSWSKPTETASSSSSSYGLVAGGLDDGSVAVWDPRHMLRDAEGSTSGWKSELRFIEDYFPSEDPNRQKWKCEFQIIEDHFADPDGRRPQHRRRDAIAAAGSSSEIPGSSATLRAQLMRDLGWGSAGEDLFFSPATSHHQAGVTDPSMVALFSTDMGPVKGLCFSPLDANLLASGAMKGKVLIWDLIASLKDKTHPYPATQCYGFSTSDVSDLSWNPSVSNLIASASNAGAYIWDMRSNSPLVGYFESRKSFSSIQWSPTDSNTMIVGANPGCSPSVFVFDTRRMSNPVNEFCMNSGGISSLSWCPRNDVIIGSTFNKDIFVWKGKTGKCIWEKQLDTMVTDVHWSNVNVGSFATATRQDISLYNLNGFM